MTRQPPPVTSLSRAQASGWACCFCGTPLWHGAVSAGRAPGHVGAHDLSVEVYACPDHANRPNADHTDRFPKVPTHAAPVSGQR